MFPFFWSIFLSAILAVFVDVIQTVNYLCLFVAVYRFCAVSEVKWHLFLSYFIARFFVLFSIFLCSLLKVHFRYSIVQRKSTGKTP